MALEGRCLGRSHHGEPLAFFVSIRSQFSLSDEISGGTGFTPYNQLFHSIITSSSSPKTRFTLLHSSLCPEELPPDELLAPFRRFARDRPDRLRVALHVDQLAGRNSDVVLGRIGRADIEKAAGVSNPPWYAFWRSAAQTPAPRERKIMFLICGPDT